MKGDFVHAEIFHFSRNEGGELITETPSGKPCHLDASDEIAKRVREGEYWECIPKKKVQDGARLIRPVRRIEPDDYWKIPFYWGDFTRIPLFNVITMECRDVELKNVHLDGREISTAYLKYYRGEPEQARSLFERHLLPLIPPYLRKGAMKAFDDNAREEVRKVEKYRARKEALRDKIIELVKRSPTYEEMREMFLKAVLDHLYSWLGFYTRESTRSTLPEMLVRSVYKLIKTGETIWGNENFMLELTRDFLAQLQGDDILLIHAFGNADKIAEIASGIYREEDDVTDEDIRIESLIRSQPLGGLFKPLYEGDAEDGERRIAAMLREISAFDDRFKGVVIRLRATDK